MNLLDYQKSGNAFGATVTPFAPFNPLKGAIPNIPDIDSIVTYNTGGNYLAILKYMQEIEYDPSYVPSAFGFRYDLVTPRGFAYISEDGFATDTGASGGGTMFFGRDPFSQAIGSFPLGPGERYHPFTTPSGPLDMGGVLLFGQPYILAGPSSYATYNPYSLHLLPQNYIRHVHFDKMRFTDVNEVVNQQSDGDGFGAGAEATDPLNPTEDVPLQTNSSIVHLPAINIFGTTPLSQAKKAYGDQVGTNYKTFTYRKEQYIYLFGEISMPMGPAKVGKEPQLTVLDPIPEYQIYCMATKLNFMSMFINVDDKKSAFTFSQEYTNPNNPQLNSFWAFEHSSVSGYPVSVNYPDFDRVIHEYPPGIFSQQLVEFYDQLGVSNPVTFGPLGYEFNDQYFHIMNNKISRFAFHAFKQIEDTLYTNLSFDVEPPVLNPPIIEESSGQAISGTGFSPINPDPGNIGGLTDFEQPSRPVRTSFPGGIPYNAEKVALAEWASAKDIKAPVIYTQMPYLLTANVKSVYNYLSTHWENVLREIPETAIPPIFISQGQIEGTDQPGMGKGPTQDQLISHPIYSGKNSYAFSQLYEQAMKCKSYFELNEFATNKGYGKHSKLIYIPNEKYLQDIEEAKINYPMYNEIEFDIYSNTNRAIVNLLREHGISKSILAAYMANIFAPLSKTEYFFDTTPNVEDMNALDQELYDNPEGELSQIYENMLVSLNKAYDSGVFTSAIYHGSDGSEGPGAVGGPADIDKHYYIFKTIRAPFLHEVGNQQTQVDSVATNFPHSKININLDKFFQYYVTTYNAQQGFIDPGNVELEEGFMLKDSNSYSDYYSEFGPPDKFHKGAAGLDDDSASSYVLGMAILPEIQRKIQQLMPQINEILSHKPNYSEPLMYEIEKSIGYLDGKNVIQRIFIPHFGEGFDEKALLTQESEEPKIKKIKYIDTQVKYGQVYTYKIKQYRLVVGGDYRFVFSSNEDTHRRAFSMGYGERYESDIIMKAARAVHQEGTMVYDAVSPPFDAVDGTTPITSFNQPFMFYTKIPNYDVPYNPTKPNAILDIVEYASNTEDDYPIEDVPDYFSGEEPSKSQRLQKLAIFKSMVYPNVQITPVPYYEQTVAVVDFPPLPPNVNIDPLVGKGSTVLMTFEHQVGDREEVPIYVNDHDKYLFALQRSAQNRDSQNGSGQFVTPSIRFKTDDFPKAYQIFVIDKKPSNYQSFKDKMALELNVEDATAIKQSLVPNKKYYFMFRTVDIHGNISNPSIVYEVEMVFNSGVYYPIVNEYEFEKQTIGTKIKPFKQYAKIEAALIQRVVNMGASGIDEQSSVMQEGRKPILGVANDKIWNQKKFKFRIISKHTGKAIDLNVKFKTNYTESGENGCS